MKVFINPGHSKNANPDPGCCYNNIKEALICEELSKAVEEKLKSCGVSTELYQQDGTGITSNAQLNKVPIMANKSGANAFVSIHMNGASSSSAKGVEVLYYKDSANSKKLADCIQSEMIKAYANYQFTNRGIKPDTRNLLVLRATTMPAALIEVGFISNKEEADFIKSNINSIAERICRGICQYLNVKVDFNPSKLNIKLERDSDGLYNCYINDTLKLKSNRLETCLDWIKKNYD